MREFDIFYQFLRLKSAHPSYKICRNGRALARQDSQGGQRVGGGGEL